MDGQRDVTNINKVLLIDQGHPTATNWSRLMQEREEVDNMWLEGMRMGIAVKAMRWVG
jgi:hypothetical protein